MNRFFNNISQCLAIGVVALTLAACTTTESPTVAATPAAGAAMSIAQDSGMTHEGAMQGCCCKKMMQGGKTQCSSDADGKKSCCCSDCCKKSAAGGMQCDPAMGDKKSGAQGQCCCKKMMRDAAKATKK